MSQEVPPPPSSPNDDQAPRSEDSSSRAKHKLSKPKALPMWKVILHDDGINEVTRVVETVDSLTHLGKEVSISRTLEASKTGRSMLLTTHKERAELYLQQFSSKNLHVTIEPV